MLDPRASASARPLPGPGRVALLQPGQRLPAVRVSTPPEQRVLQPANFFYSTRKGDVRPEALAELFRTVRDDSAGQPTTARATAARSLTARSFFAHWGVLSEPEALEKLQLLLDYSVVIVAAFTRDPLPTPWGDAAAAGDDFGAQASTPGGATAGAAAAGAADAALHPWAPRWQWRRPRQLVGFVRASGDKALVATIHDVLVHPAVRGRGVGRALVCHAASAVRRQGVYDVGLVTPAELAPFFGSTDFAPDREASVPMTLLRDMALMSARDRAAALAASPRLRSLLAEELEAA